MKKIAIHQVDAFTDTIFGGNPAAVVPDANGLSDKNMLRISREMNLSETAFVSKATSPDADFQLRWFTPTDEVDFCGHATIGTLYELTRLQLFGLGKEGTSTVRVETKAGILAMQSTVKKGKITATYAMPKPQLQAYPLQGKAFAKAFGIPATSLDPKAKVMINIMFHDILIPVVSVEVLQKLSFDFIRIKEYFAKEQIIVFGLFAVEDEVLHVRGLAPLVGIDEDPFTGRLQAELLMTAKANELVPQTKNIVTTRQGHLMNNPRPGEAQVKVDLKTGTITVSAPARHVFSTEITF